MVERSYSLAKITAAAVLGWVLCDLAAVVTTPEPGLVRVLLPSCVLAIGLGAFVGALCGLHRAVFWVGVCVAAGAAALPLWSAVPSSAGVLWLPRVVLLLMFAAAAAAWVAPRLHVPPVGTALTMGIGAAIVAAACMGQVRGLSVAMFIAAAVGIESARMQRRGARILGAAASLAVAIAATMILARQHTALRRPDQPLPPVVADPGRPNLVMIVLDTVRADHLAAYGYERDTTPGLDAFVREHATLYSEAYATSSWTLPSHASLFTGLYPSEHGAHHCRTKHAASRVTVGSWHAQPLRRDVPTLAERLAARGYQTAAIIANSAYLAHEMGVDRGFAHYDDRWGPNVGGPLLVQLAGVARHAGHSMHRSAEAITDEALAWIAGRPPRRPFFLFLNYLDPHVPYLPPSPHDTAFSDEQPDDPYEPNERLLPLLYDRELHYLDEHVTRLLRAMEDLGVLDNSVVIITSDHGEAFGEHGFWRHDRMLYGEVLRVPLYVKRAGQRSGARSAQRMTGVAVHDLALRELGLETGATRPHTDVIAEWYRSPEFAAAVKDSPVDINRDLLAWLEGRVKWIVSSTGSVEAYDLDQDPQERRNLAMRSEQIEPALARAAAWWAAHPPLATVSREPPAVDPSVRERMRNLGYAD